MANRINPTNSTALQPGLSPPGRRFDDHGAQDAPLTGRLGERSGSGDSREDDSDDHQANGSRRPRPLRRVATKATATTLPGSRTAITTAPPAASSRAATARVRARLPIPRAMTFATGRKRAWRRAWRVADPQ